MMAKRAMMYCPSCRDVGQRTMELYTDMPELDVFRCMNSHAFPSYMLLMAMNPDKIKLVAQEKPQPNDVKAEFWVDKDILHKFREAYPHQQNSTVASILSLFLYGDPIIIDGIQAKKMHALGVKNGQEMLAALEVGKTLEAQLAAAQERLSFIESLIKGANIEALV